MPQLWSLTISEAADLMKKGDLSPVDLTRAHLERIRALDPQLRSYITVTGELALKEAAQAASEIGRGRYRGPLHGIPISYKDIIATKGIRTTGGSRTLADWLPQRDARVVERLRNAGAVTLGKASTFEFAFGGTTETDYVKPARNPWNLELSPGGSSSGSAAGLAAGLAMASIGSDSGGSIRNPANMCGITGLKPTYGRVSRLGVLPLSYSFDTVGPMTRSAEDAAIVLSAIAGYDPEDPASLPEPVPGYRSLLTRKVAGLRVGILPAYMDAVGMDRDVASAFQEALRVLRSLGMTMRELSVPHLTYSRACTWTILRLEGFHHHFSRLRDRRSDLGLSFFRNTAVGGFLSAQDYLRAQQARRLIAMELAKAFREVDIIATPTNPKTAGPATYRKEPSDSMVARSGEAYVTPFNVNGSPALSIPCGLGSNGLPASLQLAGRPFDEATVLAAGRQYQSVTDWHNKVPRTW